MFFKAKNISPVLPRQGYALVGDEDIISAIVLLLLACSPVAIIRRISFVVVSALKGVSIRTLAHIRDEVFEFIPARADGDASASITRVFSRLWIAASVSHVGPSSILRGIVLTMYSAMWIFTQLFKLMASAGFSVTGFKFPIFNNVIVAARAFAMPVSFAMPSLRRRYYCKSVKRLSGNVFKSTHGISPVGLRLQFNT